MESAENLQTTPEDALSYIAPIGHSYYARTTSMGPTVYQSLIDRCWRRSGSLLYRPNQRDACCPHYTLRLDSSQFRTSRDQRHAINKFNKYVMGEAYMKESARLYPRSREEAKRRDNEFDLVERIHESEAQLLKRPPQPAHVFEVTLETDEFTEEKFAVYENYQKVVHKESHTLISRNAFKRFLCSSPLRRGTFKSADGKERRVGSFHQCYRIDGRLVAIGVLDLLPDCVSAVYFLYHESIHQWQPGKLGALREIALASEQGYRWWYSGFYIHTCPKMRYKIDYSPQFVLDPDRLSWLELDKNILQRFDATGYLNLDGLPGQDSTEIKIGPESIPIPMDTEEKSAENSGAEDLNDGKDPSLFGSNMPGIPSLEQMESVELDHVPIRLSHGFCFAGDLLQWTEESISDRGSAKGIVAELAAAIGPDLLSQCCLDFRRPGL